MLFSTELESIYDPLEKNMNVTSQLEHKYSAFKILSFWHILSTNGSTGLHRGSKSVINLHQSLSLHPSAPAFVSNSLHRTDRNLTETKTKVSTSCNSWNRAPAVVFTLGCHIHALVLYSHSPSQDNQIHELCTSLSASSPSSDLTFSMIFLTWIRKAKKYLSPSEKKTLSFLS